MEGASRCRSSGASTCRWRSRVCGVCAGVGELPLEQLPVAAGGDQFGQLAAPLTVGLQVFAPADQGIDWSIITAATLS